MKDNANIVKRWAELMLDYVDEALDELDDCKYPGAYNAARCCGQIKGCCEAIVAAMEGTGDD